MRERAARIAGKTEIKLVVPGGIIFGRRPNRGPGLGVMSWRTETTALQPWKSPTHLNNSSPRAFFLVSSLKASRTFFVSSPPQKKRDLYRWTV